MGNSTGVGVLLWVLSKPDRFTVICRVWLRILVRFDLNNSEGSPRGQHRWGRKKRNKRQLQVTPCSLRRIKLICLILLSKYQLSSNYCIFCRFCGLLSLCSSPQPIKSPSSHYWMEKNHVRSNEEGTNRLEIKRLPLVPVNHDYHEPSCQLKHQVEYQPHLSWRDKMLLTGFLPSPVDHVYSL